MEGTAVTGEFSSALKNALEKCSVKSFSKEAFESFERSLILQSDGTPPPSINGMIDLREKR